MRQAKPVTLNPSSAKYAQALPIPTDKLLYRPYTIFTLKDKSNENDNTNAMIGSKILGEIVCSMMFSKGDLAASHPNLPAIHSIQKIYENIENMQVIGNSDIETTTIALAQMITSTLKNQNESIQDLMDLYADNL